MRKNWMTTVGGLLAGIPGAILASGLVLPPTYHQMLALMGALGVLLLGVAAKGQDEHSTSTQVAVSTQAANSGTK